jgi:hypothetical protein
VEAGLHWQCSPYGTGSDSGGGIYQSPSDISANHHNTTLLSLQCVTGTAEQDVSRTSVLIMRLPPYSALDKSNDESHNWNTSIFLASYLYPFFISRCCPFTSWIHSSIRKNSNQHLISLRINFFFAIPSFLIVVRVASSCQISQVLILTHDPQLCSYFLRVGGVHSYFLLKSLPFQAYNHVKIVVEHYGYIIIQHLSIKFRDWFNINSWKMRSKCEKFTTPLLLTLVH